jgi:hypothetical protein
MPRAASEYSPISLCLHCESHLQHSSLSTTRLHTYCTVMMPGPHLQHTGMPELPLAAMFDAAVLMPTVYRLSGMQALPMALTRAHAPQLLALASA